MPAVIVRRRMGRRSLDLNYRLQRWYGRHRAQLTLTAVFLVACALGLAVSTAALRDLLPL